MDLKKRLPVIGAVLLVVVFIVGVLVIRHNNASQGTDNQDDLQNVPDLPADQRPTAALVPTSDGHYLGLKITDIKVKGASSMDYELLWKANNSGVTSTQGTSSTIQLNGQTSVSKDLLLGSESNGKFRYDKGVETGTLTLRFRDGTGKLLGKVATDFHLQTGTTALSSPDGSFKYTLTKAATGVYFVTMMSFGNPDMSKVVTFQNGWAIYASDGLPHK